MKHFPSRPLPDFKCLRRALFSDKTLNSELIFFDLGREALAFGIEALEIEPGTSILIPAYMCESTIDPLRNLGFEIIFFDVKKDLNFDLNMIETLIRSSNVKAILSVHYFGFPCDLDALVKLCKRYDVRVIEDCSHSYLTQISGQSIGCFGDMAIYSMRKTLAIPDGGALKLNVGVPIRPEVIEKKLQWFKEVLYLGSRLLESVICFIGFPNLYSIKVDQIKNFLRNIKPGKIKDSSSVTKVAPIRSSFQLKAYLNDSDYTFFIAERRKHNYHILAKEALRLGLNPFLHKLPNGCVPQFFILIDEKQQLAPWLRGQGIGATSWPGSELSKDVYSQPSKFPVTNFLNETLVLLPIHQSMSSQNLEKTLNLLQSWAEMK